MFRMLFGLALFLLGVVGLLVSYFGASIDYAHRSTEILNWDVAAGTLVLWGAISATLTLLGVWALKAGAKSSWQHRNDPPKGSRTTQPSPEPAPEA